MRRPWLIVFASLILISLACNYAAAPPPTQPPDPIQTPTPAAALPTPVIATATPTPEPATGRICVLAYRDSNANAMRDESELPLPDVRFSLLQGAVEVAVHRSTEADEPYCFQELAPGNYQLHAEAPPRFAATNPATLSISLNPGKRLPVVLGFKEIELAPDGRMVPGDNDPAQGLVVNQPPDATFYLVAQKSLYRTDDSGQTWRPVGPRPPAAQVVMSPAEHDLLLAGDGYACFRGGPDMPLFVSQDGGARWTELPAGLNLRPAASHPLHQDVAWAVGCDGIYRTDDRGVTWQHQSADAWSTYIVAFLEAAASQPDVLYAAGNSEGGSGALFRSDDGGRSWRTLTAAPELWVSGLLVHPSNPAEAWFTTPTGVWHSQDGGSSWTASRSGLENVAVQDDYQFEGKGLYGLSRSSAGILYLGTARGVFRSNDGGGQWQPSSASSWAGDPVESLVAVDAWGASRLWLVAGSGVYVYTPPAP